MSDGSRSDTGYGSFDFACEQMREGVPETDSWGAAIAGAIQFLRGLVIDAS